jgi:hypothetical protein
MSSEAPPESSPLALGETVFDGGFHRVSPGPAPLALARLRELLLEVGAVPGTPLGDALEGFQSWSSLAVLAGTDWAAGLRRGSLSARRLLQRRLRPLGARPISATQASALPVGSAVHVPGIIRAMSRSRLNAHMSYIWSHSAMSTHNVRFLVEQGDDFFLIDEEGQSACVIAARGHLINADRLVAGDRVSVFGFTDRVADPRRGTDGPGTRDARVLALRAGDDGPLLVRRVTGG